MELRLQEWSQTIRQEYLQRFIGQGGSSMKFVVAPSVDDRVHVQKHLAALAEVEHYAHVHVDAKETKVHMMDRFFHQVSSRIPWDALASQFVRRLLQENGYQIPVAIEDFCMVGVARMNERAEPLLRRDLNSWLQRAIYRDTKMCQEFRLAMIRLCLGQLDSGSESPFMTEAIKAWLCGELRQISALKDALIFQKIVQTNAWYMFASLSRWLRVVGRTGLVVSLDLSRCLEPKKADLSDGLHYSVSAVLDVYEMLRQFIDGTDELESLLLVVVAPPTFLTDPRRGFSRYEALKLRVWDERRDRHYQNPLGALIQLEEVAKERSDLVNSLENEGQAAMANGDVSHQRAMEALRSGVPNRDIVKILGSQQPDLEGRFRRFLQQMETQAPQGIPTTGMVIEGGFGNGKSHLLKALQHLALKQHFICSPIAISKETLFHNVPTFFRSAINHAIVPGKQGDPLTEIAGELNFQSPHYTELFDWAHRKDQPCDTQCAATLYLYERLMNDPEVSHRMIRFWAGDPLGNGQLKKYLQGCAPEEPYVFEKVMASDLARSRFQFVSRLMLAAGYKGWILLIDQVEAIARYSFKQRLKSYVEIAHWLGIIEETACPGISTVIALTDDFQNVVFEDKQELMKIEPACMEGDDSDCADLTRVALRGVRLLEERRQALLQPYDSMVDALYESLRSLHGSAYSWDPPSVSAVEKLSSARMREHVRGWIAEWDLRRLYPDAQLDSEILDVSQTDTEEPELEAQVAERSDRITDSEEFEDTMLAVATQNQSSI